MVMRLSVDARTVLFTAGAEEARRRGDRRLGTDHLLLALLHDPDSAAARALGVSLQQARSASESLDRAALAAVGVNVRQLGTPRRPALGRGLPPLTSAARAVVKQAVEEARPMKTGRIEPADFLLALLRRERPDAAAELLAALGLDAAGVRTRLGGCVS